MNPYQHGEVFVTEDGAETDLDLGHYERFLNVNARRISNFTSGAVYRTVMDMEREGEYLGKTIQIIPHVTNEIKRRIELAHQDYGTDFITVEVGGTVGDIEALPFIEALRQFREEHRETSAVVHVVKIDYLYPSDEAKTKPIQHSVATLRGYGLQPDILIIRCKRELEPEEREKIALFCGVSVDHIVTAVDADSLYAIPEQMDRAGLASAIASHFNLPKSKISKAGEVWKNLRSRECSRNGEVTIGLVGKYTAHSDAYISVIEAIKHAGIYHGVHVRVVPIDSEDVDVVDQAGKCDGIVIPGGFGTRGIDGKIATIKMLRETKTPFLGICLGLQVAVIEYARHVAGMKRATSAEFDESAREKVVAYLPGQEGIQRKGGTMRLGSYKAKLVPKSLVASLYATYRPEELQKGMISERHRHRYEVNPKYQARLAAAGLVLSGLLPERNLVEFIELPPKVHPFFVATQAHPEFRSRPEYAHPLFAGLIAAALTCKDSKNMV